MARYCCLIITAVLGIVDLYIANVQGFVSGFVIYSPVVASLGEKISRSSSCTLSTPQYLLARGTSLDEDDDDDDDGDDDDGLSVSNASRLRKSNSLSSQQQKQGPPLAPLLPSDSTSLPPPLAVPPPPSLPSASLPSSTSSEAAAEVATSSALPPLPRGSKRRAQILSQTGQSSSLPSPSPPLPAAAEFALPPLQQEGIQSTINSATSSVLSSSLDEEDEDDDDDDEEEDDSGFEVSTFFTDKVADVAQFKEKKKGVSAEAEAEFQKLATGSEETEFIKRDSERNAKRARMLERGMTETQISTYLGEETTTGPTQAEKAIRDAYISRVKQEQAYEARRALYGKVPSHELVKLDEDGEPMIDRFAYVDEYTCIGCTNCASVAPDTFFMEDDKGRARAYQQGATPAAALQEAISTCPVDCIHYVSWEELQRLEKEREGMDINYKARLVGNMNEFKNGMQVISGDRGARCSNCPSKGCRNCPMYSVGQNPEYVTRATRIRKKKKARLAEERLAAQAASGRRAEL